MTNKPTFSMRRGSIEAAAWVNRTKTRDGRDYQSPSVKVERRIRTADGDWKSTNSYNITDLLKLQHFCGQVIERAMQEESRLQSGESA